MKSFADADKVEALIKVMSEQVITERRKFPGTLDPRLFPPVKPVPMKTQASSLDKKKNNKSKANHVKPPEVSLPAEFYPITLFSPMFYPFVNQYAEFLRCYHYFDELVDTLSANSDLEMVNAMFGHDFRSARGLARYLVEKTEQVLIYYQRHHRQKYVQKLPRDLRLLICRNKSLINDNEISQGEVKYCLLVETVVAALHRLVQHVGNVPEKLNRTMDYRVDQRQLAQNLMRAADTIIAKAEQWAKQKKFLVPTISVSVAKRMLDCAGATLDDGKLLLLVDTVEDHLMIICHASDVLRLFLKSNSIQVMQSPLHDINFVECMQVLMKLKVLAIYHRKEMENDETSPDMARYASLMPPLLSVLQTLLMVKQLFEAVHQVYQTNKPLHLDCLLQIGEVITANEFSRARDQVQALLNDVEELCQVKSVNGTAPPQMKQ